MILGRGGSRGPASPILQEVHLRVFARPPDAQLDKFQNGVGSSTGRSILPRVRGPLDCYTSYVSEALLSRPQ